jgi:hypothetical protein
MLAMTARRPEGNGRTVAGVLDVDSNEIGLVQDRN